MTHWIAVGHGALDLRFLEPARGTHDCVVTAIWPAEPVLLEGPVAALWRRLVDGPVDDQNLTAEEQSLVREFEDFGIASRSLCHVSKISTLPAPWMGSLLHELVYALVASVAREIQVDAVFIKGPFLHRQGLRSRKRSGDVDVWVHPAQVDRLASAMALWGWRRSPGFWEGTDIHHSVTLLPPEWGCEVDIHRHLPGFGLEQRPLFDELSRHTEQAAVAGIEVRIPAKPAHAVIWALHSLRPTIGAQTSQAQVASARDTLASAGAGAVEFATVTGAITALRPALEYLYSLEELGQDHPHPLNWDWRSARTVPQGLWAAIRGLPLPSKIRLVLRFIWPPAEIVLLTDARAGIPTSSVFWSRLRKQRAGFVRLWASLKGRNQN